MRVILQDSCCVVHIPFVHMVNFEFLSHLPVDHLAPPFVSSLIIFLCFNLPHSFIMWLMVPSLSLHSLHLLFWCSPSILALIWLVLMALFCATIRRNSVSLLKFPFLSHVRFSRVRCLFVVKTALLDFFSNQLLLMVFLWSLSDRKSPQVFGTHLSISFDL